MHCLLLSFTFYSLWLLLYLNLPLARCVSKLMVNYRGAHIKRYTFLFVFFFFTCVWRCIIARRWAEGERKRDIERERKSERKKNKVKEKETNDKNINNSFTVNWCSFYFWVYMRCCARSCLLLLLLLLLRFTFSLFKIFNLAIENIHVNTHLHTSMLKASEICQCKRVYTVFVVVIVVSIWYFWVIFFSFFSSSFYFIFKANVYFFVVLYIYAYSPEKKKKKKRQWLKCRAAVYLFIFKWFVWIKRFIIVYLMKESREWDRENGDHGHASIRSCDPSEEL